MAQYEARTRVASDAIGIWQAGVDAVRADRIVANRVIADGLRLCVEESEYRLHPNGRLIVVGAGKATFKMGQGLVKSLAELDDRIEIEGWLNVPQGTADGLLDKQIAVCEARPLGVNEPTRKVVEGTERIIGILAQARPQDTIVCLLSGGGSALLCLPIEGLALEDKLEITRRMSAGGATIEQLNLVRSALSRVKRGGLLRGCRAGQVVTLVLSDVLGDPLSTIASGPTYCEEPIDFSQAAKWLDAFVGDAGVLRQKAQRALEKRQDQDRAKPAMGREGSGPRVAHHILANNATAVDAAGVEAVRRGYAYYMESSPRSEGSAETLGRALANQCLRLAVHPEIQCVISGGEPNVVLPSSDRRGKGGRNQHLVLAALDEMKKQGVQPQQLTKIAVLSGGTDGEDGPTDAAGAWFDASVERTITDLGLSPGDFLARCDSYNFFAQTNSLLKTGPTHTNVCDIRVLIYDSRIML